MNNQLKLFIYVVLTSFIIFLGISYLSSTTTEHHINDDTYSSIIVERLDDSSALVKYQGVNTQDTYEMYVEVEYPDPDYTLEEELDMEIAYAIEQIQELYNQ